MSKKTLNVKLRKPLICDYCARSFILKANLVKHLRFHNAQQNLPRAEGLTCDKCNLVFKNKGLLMCHNVKVHEKKSVKTKHICHACQSHFIYKRDLKDHIRESHFNLLSQIPYCNFKKVNQVWFEKVQNSKNIVEIKKVAENILLLRKLDDNTAMKVSDHTTEVLDLRHMYPSQPDKNVKCRFCFKMYDKAYINKHLTDIHLKYKDKEFVQE